ncbi:hypothetical protein RhiirA4_522631, partial [Rhizophagus irregularis]
MDKSRISNKAAVDFVSKFNEIYFQSISHHLSSFVQDGFLKELFEKNPSAPVDKAQLLIRKFGDAANPANFTEQAQATNIQPTTLSLIFSIAFYAASRSWENFSSQFLSEFGDLYEMSEADIDDMFDESSVDEHDLEEDLGLLSEEDLLKKGFQIPPPPKPVIVTPPILPDVDMTPVDQTVTPETSRKKDKQKALRFTWIVSGRACSTGHFFSSSSGWASVFPVFDDSVRNPNNAEDFLKFISYNGDMFLHGVIAQLSSFVENGFLKTLFDKSLQAMDKAQLLVETFGECANPNNFTLQAKATNIQPTTLSLIFSIALLASSRAWDNFSTRAYTLYGDMGDDTESECPSADDELFTSTSSSNTKKTPPILPD